MFFFHINGRLVQMRISSTWWLVILSPSRPKEETPESPNNFSFMAPRYVIYHMATTTCPRTAIIYWFEAMSHHLMKYEQ